MSTIQSFLATAKARFPRTADVVRRNLPGIVREHARLRGKSPAEVFQMIHDENLWRSSESKSGWGSTLESTAQLRKDLPVLWRDLDVRSVVDAPCGDFNWMRHVEPIANGTIDYTGGDIVPKLAEQNQASYSSPTRRFTHLNIITDKLPAADLFFCRDCLIHLSNDTVRATLLNVARSNFRYVALNNYPDLRYNPDIPTGSVRPFNLMIAPFNLPKPHREIRDEGGHQPTRKVLAVWTIEQVRSACAPG